MNKIKNKIITISGEPASGKSTVVKVIEEKYKKCGYKVHIISVGEVFRETIKKEYLKMYPDKKDANLADIQSDVAFMESRKDIDEKIDEEIRRKGIEISSKELPNDVYIIDSRLAWSNIPESFSVRLIVSEQIAGKRVFDDNTRGKEDQYDTLEDATEKTRKRKLGEIERYKQRYGVELNNPDNYKLVIDTSYSNIEELADIVIKGVCRNGEYYPKYWSSPARFLPTQGIKDTCSMTMYGYTIEDLVDRIKEEGYNYTNGTVDVIEKNETKFLADGNHRAFAALATGKTLIPYVLPYKDDKMAERRILGIVGDNKHTEYIYDYVDLIEYYGGKLGNLEQFKQFSIKDLPVLTDFQEPKINPNDDGR